MMRIVATLGLLALLVAAPAALAQEKNDTTRPDDAAWVEDCPPDMMCAADAEEPSRGPADGSCENCRGDEEPIPFGPEGCIECTGGPVDEGETCMDGQQGDETCRDDVQYFGDEPYSTGPQAESASTDAKTVPALGALGLLAAFVAAVALVARRH